MPLHDYFVCVRLKMQSHAKMPVRGDATLPVGKGVPAKSHMHEDYRPYARDMGAYHPDHRSARKGRKDRAMHLITPTCARGGDYPSPSMGKGSFHVVHTLLYQTQVRTRRVSSQWNNVLRFLLTKRGGLGGRRQANLCVSVVEDRVVLAHEYVAKDPERAHGCGHVHAHDRQDAHLVVARLNHVLVAFEGVVLNFAKRRGGGGGYESNKVKHEERGCEGQLGP